MKCEKRKRRQRESSEDSSESSSEDEDRQLRKKQSREKKRVFDLKYEYEDRNERNVSREHGRHSSSDSKEYRDGRDKREDNRKKNIMIEGKINIIKVPLREIETTQMKGNSGIPRNAGMKIVIVMRTEGDKGTRYVEWLTIIHVEMAEAQISGSW